LRLCVEHSAPLLIPLAFRVASALTIFPPLTSMNLTRFTLLAFAAASLFSTARAQISPIRLRVEQSNKNNTTSYKTVQARTLTIYLTNSSQQPADVVVKWAVLGRDIKTKDFVTIESGEMKSSLAPSGNDKRDTPTVNASSEEARVGSKGKTDDVGNKIIGHGVQVWQGDKLIAETYEPASIKEHFGKAPTAKPLDQQKPKKK
jgi:hypothetical protein